MTNENKNHNITGRVKSFEDAMAITGRPDVPDLSNFPEDMRDYFTAQYKMCVITEALQEGWKADWSDGCQCKWIPWFDTTAEVHGGFAFCATNCDFSIADAGDASRLCYPTAAIAEYAGRHFVEIWEVIIKK